MATLRAGLQDSREALAVPRSEKVYQEHTLAEQFDVNGEQARKLYEATEALTAAREIVVDHWKCNWLRSAAAMPSKRMSGAPRLDELEGENVMLKTKATGSVPKVRGRKT